MANTPTDFMEIVRGLRDEVFAEGPCRVFKNSEAYKKGIFTTMEVAAPVYVSMLGVEQAENKKRRKAREGHASNN